MKRDNISTCLSKIKGAFQKSSSVPVFVSMTFLERYDTEGIVLSFIIVIVLKFLVWGC